MSKRAERLARALFWEFFQNLPLVAGFMTALVLWRRGSWPSSTLIMGFSSVLGALTIGATESRIVAGHREPLRVVVVNVATMTGVMLMLTIYLSTAWSSWPTDLALGALVGILLGGAQDLAAGEPLDVRHCLALAGAFGPTLIGIRLLADNLSILVSVPILTIVVTSIIVLVDYGDLLSTVQDRVGG